MNQDKTRAITEGDSYPQHKTWLKRSYYLVLSYYSKLELFSIFSHSDLDFVLSDPKSNPKWSLVACYISISMTISYSKEKLLNWNHFSIFSHSDLYLDPSSPKSKPKQGLVTRMLYLKLHDHIWFQTQVIEIRPFVYFLPKWPWHWPKCP